MAKAEKRVQGKVKGLWGVPDVVRLLHIIETYETQVVKEIVGPEPDTSKINGSDYNKASYKKWAEQEQKARKSATVRLLSKFKNALQQMLNAADEED